MRKQIIAVFAATIALLAMTPSAMSGERYHRQRLSPEEAYVAGKAVEALGHILGAAIANSGRRNRTIIYYDAPRPRRHSGWTGRRLSGYGEVVGAGDYCPYRLYYSQYDGRYYCDR
jgi:hypothetical protein